MKPWERAAQEEQAKKPWEVAAQPEEGEWYEEFGKGLGYSGLKTYYGLKDLITDLDDDDRDTLADWKTDSGWGTAGEVVGDIGQFLIPGGAVTKLSKAKDIGKVGTTLMDMMASAGLSAAQLPEEGETRAENAMWDAIGGGVGSTATHLLSKAGRGVSRTPQAQSLMDMGVRLTPGQAASSQTVRGLEAVLDVMPGTSQGVRELADRAREDYVLQTLKQAAPNPAGITDAGTTGRRQLQKQINDGYEAAWEGAPPLKRKVAKEIKGSLSDLAKVADMEDVNKFKRMHKNVTHLSRGEPDPMKFVSLDRNLGKAAKRSKNDPEMLNDIQYIRDLLRAEMPPAALDQLNKMDALYPDYLTVKKAANYAKNDGGMFTPQQLMRASEQVGGATKKFIDQSPLHDIAGAGLETLGRKKDGQPLEWFRRLSYMFPSSTPLMDAMRRLTLGQAVPNKALQKGEEVLPRSLLTAIGAGL